MPDGRQVLPVPKKITTMHIMRAAVSLAEEDHVDVIVSPFGSERIAGVINVTNRYNLLNLGCSSEDYLFKDSNSYFSVARKPSEPPSTLQLAAKRVKTYVVYVDTDFFESVPYAISYLDSQNVTLITLYNATNMATSSNKDMCDEIHKMMNQVLNATNGVVPDMFIGAFADYHFQMVRDALASLKYDFKLAVFLTPISIYSDSEDVQKASGVDGSAHPALAQPRNPRPVGRNLLRIQLYFLPLSQQTAQRTRSDHRSQSDDVLGRNPPRKFHRHGQRARRAAHDAGDRYLFRQDQVRKRVEPVHVIHPDPV
jgi:hypothetical protein